MKRTQLIGLILTVLVLLGAVAPQVSAQIISKKGTTSANFLLIPVGYPAENAEVPSLKRKSLQDVAVFY